MKNRCGEVKRILVVEDEPTISQVCRRTLASERCEVDIAVNGNIAEDMLQKKDYDICLIDLRTPVMNGRQFYQVIISKHSKLVKGVIFTTGDLIDGYTQRFLELARRPYLTKPFTPNELRRIVRETLREIEK